MAYIGKQPVVGNFVKLDAITTSATTTFNLLNGGVSYYPQSANNCIVSLNGVIQSPTSAYTISGSTIVFSDALTSSDTIDFILVLGDVLNIGTPSDATVGFSKVTSNLITGATAVTTPATDDVLLCYDTSATALRKITYSDFGNTPSFHAYLASDQTGVVTSTYTKVLFDSENWDTHSAFASNKFTVPTGYAGKYVFNYRVKFSGIDDTEYVKANVYINGNAYYGSETPIYSSNLDQQIASSGTFIVSLSAGDYVELYCWHNEGANRSLFGSNPLTSGTDGSWFSGYKLIGV
jgi:hypothetical protein